MILTRSIADATRNNPRAEKPKMYNEDKGKGGVDGGGAVPAMNHGRASEPAPRIFSTFAVLCSSGEYVGGRLDGRGVTENPEFASTFNEADARAYASHISGARPVRLVRLNSLGALMALPL